MTTNPDFIPPCGLYCGVCAIYIAALDNNTKLKKRLVNLYEVGTPAKGTLPNSESLAVEDIHCRGACQMIFLCIANNVRSGPAPKKEVTQVVTSAMIFHASTLIIFQWPWARRSFCAPSRIDENLEQKNGFETKRLGIYAQSAVIRCFVER